MKLPTLTVIFIIIASAVSRDALAMNYDNYNVENLSQIEQSDSLMITFFVSFTVNENGKTRNAKIEKIECSEFNMEELDKFEVEKLEKEALRVVEEMDDFDPIEKPTRFMLPIKMKLPTDKYLIK